MNTPQGLREAQEALREALGPFGYSAECVRFDCDLPNRDAMRGLTNEARGAGGPGGARRVDVLAFADSCQQTWDTTLIAADLQRDMVVGTAESEKTARELLELTAAPTNIVGSYREGKVDIWVRCHDGKALLPRVALQPGKLAEAFGRHRADVQRQRLAQLRVGQRHLFDAYLYAQRDGLADFLQQGVSRAFGRVDDRDWGATDKLKNDARAMFSRVAIALLAARILEDKGALGPGRGQTIDPQALLADAKRSFDAFFNKVVDEDLPALAGVLGRHAIEQMTEDVLAHLTGPVTFRLVTHETLGDLNERALVAERRTDRGRGTLVPLKGVHYTPQSIARQILDRIPIEYIPVGERCVYDFACGSGSFLLAATERLAGLYDVREPGAQVTCLHHLTGSVLGNDIDPVSGLIVDLSYLDAYWQRTGGARNQIPLPQQCREDALSLDPCQAFGRPPSVIVGNPPFDAPGQPVGKFLLRALHTLEAEANGGPRYLGMVMPGGFLLGKREHREARNALLARTRLLDVWELPEKAIGLHAEHPTCVILAEVGGKRRQTHLVSVRQTISRKDGARRRIRDHGVFTWAYAADLSGARVDGPDGSDYALSFSEIDRIWARLQRGSRTVSCLADIVWGFVHTNMHGKPRPEFRAGESPNAVPFLRRQSVLGPYALTEADWRSSHSLGQHPYWVRGTGPAPCRKNWPKYESPKILLKAQTNRDVRSQVAAAIDLDGIYPGKHFLAVVLRDGWAATLRHQYDVSRRRGMDKVVLRWLCGILNGPVGHAWFAKNAGPRGSRAEVCLSLPLPSQYDPDISTAVKLLMETARPVNLRRVATWNPTEGLTGHISTAADEEAKRYWDTVDLINRLVLQSYGLSARDSRRMVDYLRAITRPPGLNDGHDADLSADTKLRVLRGRVLSLSPSRQKVKVGLSWRSLGGSDPVWIPIPKSMPGWALEPGREFTCRAPEGCALDDLRDNVWLLRDFRPVPYSYLDKDELERMIGYERNGGRE